MQRWRVSFRASICDVDAANWSKSAVRTRPSQTLQPHSRKQSAEATNTNAATICFSFEGWAAAFALASPSRRLADVVGCSGGSGSVLDLPDYNGKHQYRQACAVAEAKVFDEYSHRLGATTFTNQVSANGTAAGMPQFFPSGQDRNSLTRVSDSLMAANNLCTVAGSSASGAYQFNMKAKYAQRPATFIPPAKART